MVHESKLSAVLTDLARTLATDFSVQGILDHLVQRIVEILPVGAVGITVISAGRAPRYVAASDESALRYERLQTLVEEGPRYLSVELGAPVAVPDLATDDRFPRFAAATSPDGLASVFTFPLRRGDDPMGTLDLYRDTVGDLDASDGVAAATLADVAAAYLLNAQAREQDRALSDELRRNTLHDELTGLPNRLMLRQRLEHSALRATRSHADSAVLFVDLDRFKQVNDTHGHQVGDGLLIVVARRLAGLVRPGDTLARFAGDEFVILCEDLSSPADADLLASRIGESFSRPFWVGDIELSITASVGASYAGPSEGLSMQMLVDADAAMYRVKRKGAAREQVV